jgi:hypothetical protein
MLTKVLRGTNADKGTKVALLHPPPHPPPTPTPTPHVRRPAPVEQAQASQHRRHSGVVGGVQPQQGAQENAGTRCGAVRLEGGRVPPRLGGLRGSRLQPGSDLLAWTERGTPPQGRRAIQPSTPRVRTQRRVCGGQEECRAWCGPGLPALHATDNKGRTARPPPRRGAGHAANQGGDEECTGTHEGPVAAASAGSPPQRQARGTHPRTHHVKKHARGHAAHVVGQERSQRLPGRHLRGGRGNNTRPYNNSNGRGKGHSWVRAHKHCSIPAATSTHTCPTPCTQRGARRLGSIPPLGARLTRHPIALPGTPSRTSQAGRGPVVPG